MHLTMFAVGSRGDLQPFLALGLGLKAQGHTVRIATHRGFESWVRSLGFEYAVLEGDPQGVIQSEEGRKWMESERNPLKFAQGLRVLLGPIIREAMNDALHAAQGTDAIIITGVSYYFGHSVAQKLGVPFIQAYVQPVYPTHEFPSPLFPVALRGNRLINYATFVLGGYMIWNVFAPLVNEARREYLNLPPIGRMGPFSELMRERYPVLNGFSEWVIPRPKGWADFLHVTGYWFLDHPDYTPPADLADFLRDGEPPVYVGFGSMADRDPARMTEITVAALQKAGKRGILLTGWGGLAQSDLPDSIMKIESAPHDWLFPRMAAVVHHGGAGTTAAGLRAGKPSIVLPFFGDQPFWGYRVEKLGVGQMIGRKQLSAALLSDAISRATSDDTMRAKAATLGERIRAERGVENASALITRLLNEKPVHKPDAVMI